MKQREAIKARDEDIVILRVFVKPGERDLIQERCKANGFTMAHALRILGLEWAEGSND
ncbi:MAG: hypothetical protein HC862_24395 [Scytonema sp. RU_4_4]|nr:hypothetical protein [Scytonema sp. RU_4_4]